MGGSRRHLWHDIFILLIGLLSGLETCDDNKSVCFCKMTGHNYGLFRPEIKMDCSNIKPMMNTIPSNMPSRTGILDFSGQRIYSDEIHKLCQYRYLKHVNLAGNGLTTLPDNQFLNCFGSILSLNLTGNMFSEINSNSLKGLSRLDHLYGLQTRSLVGEPFGDLIRLSVLEVTVLHEALPSTLFDSLNVFHLKLELLKADTISTSLLNPLGQSLQEFSLHGNFIQRIHPGMFHRMTHLHSVSLNLPYLLELPNLLFQSSYMNDSMLEIKLTGIKALPPLLFTNLLHVQNIAIHGTEELPDSIFDDLSSLQMLDLSESNVGSMLPHNFFRSLTNVQLLSIAKMALTKLKHADFDKTMSLVRLNASMNEIRELENSVFDSINGTIDTIDLSFNHIKVLQHNLFTKQTSLKKLYLNNNHISTIESGVFKQCVELQELYIQNNKLYFLSQETFRSNLNLLTLDLSNNALFTLGPAVFQGAPRLWNLNIADNRLNSIQWVLANNFLSLSLLNIDFNSILCNCDLYELHKKYPGTKIVGQCVLENFLNDIGLYLKENKQCITSVYSTESSPRSVKNVQSFDLPERTENTAFVNTGVPLIFTTSHEDELSKLRTLWQDTVSVSNSDIVPVYLTESFHVYENINRTAGNDLDTVAGMVNREGSGSVLTSLLSDDIISYGVNEEPYFNETSPRQRNIFPTSVIQSTDPKFPYFHDSGQMNTTKTDTGNGRNGTDGGIITYIETEEVIKTDATETDYFYLSLAFILSVAAICTAILAFIYYRARRRNARNVYEVTNRNDVDMEVNVSRNSATTALSIKEVPSIQIESVDEDGNINVEIYQACQRGKYENEKAKRDSDSLESVDLPQLNNYSKAGNTLRSYSESSSSGKQSLDQNTDSCHGTFIG